MSGCQRRRSRVGVACGRFDAPTLLGWPRPSLGSYNLACESPDRVVALDYIRLGERDRREYRGHCSIVETDRVPTLADLDSGQDELIWHVDDRRDELRPVSR